jgi:tripartite ATP-independent transporter DctM subunit
MRKQGYKPSFAAGTVAAAGTLAAMIPPSIGLIIYGIVTDTSISKILVGGIIPGLISASIYMVGIYVIACIKPGLAPRSTAVPWKERIKATKGVWGVFVLAFVVLGGIYTGQFSPTEAGAAGATGALLLGVIARQINPGNFWTALKDTAITTAQIFIIIAGALMFSQMLTFSRVPYVFVKWVLQLPAPPIAILIGVMGMYIVLGTFMEPLGIMFITLPVIFPAIIALKFNPIWFGILMTKTMEIGLITPPVGMNVYALKSATPDISLEDIFKGAAWFVIMDVLTLALLISFPSIVTFLPNLMQ